MTPERWARIKEVLASVLEQPEQQRTAFLNEACGLDQELRREVDSLLAAERVSSLESPLPTMAAGQRSASVPPGLTAGQMLGHYRIDSKLGEGGMGVVYKARDTHLDRLVAIKVLPPDKVADWDRKRRFIQEAKAASALNHPNIITIHDIAHEDGVDFIVMEYLPGRTLSQVIPHKGMPLDQALRHAVEIAGALAAAHAAGIIHRDVKPANIMITGQGRVKVLDFGLAKLTEPAGSGEEEVSGSATAMTGPGMILGTAAYMSPEQAQGIPVDARSDIFSFGSVLYEMVTGRRAFPGGSPISTVTAILNQEPVPLNAELPRNLENVISRCWRKDRARRFQHMDDVRIALEDLLEESRTLPQPAQTRWPRRPWSWLVAFVLVGAAAGVGWWWAAQSRQPALRGLKTKSPEMPAAALPLTSYPGIAVQPSFSPDGNQVAFVWNGEKQDNFDIYVKVIGTDKPLRLTTDPARKASPAWSPDGRSIAFWRSLGPTRGGIFLASPIGGPERQVTETAPGTPRSVETGQADPRSEYTGGLPSLAAWSPDGKWLVISDKTPRDRPASLFLLSPETGERQRLTEGPQEVGDHAPAFSPDGRTLAFLRQITDGVRDIYLLALSRQFTPNGRPRRLTFLNQYISRPTWTRDGREIVFASGPMWSGRCGLWRMPVTGSEAPRRLEFSSDDSSFPTISRQGALAYTRTLFDPNIWRVELSGPGGKTALPKSFIASTRTDRNARFSPDGQRIAFVSSRSGNPEIWVCDRDGSNPLQLTSMRASITGSPRWSPDGQRLVFDSTREGQFELYLIASNGGPPQRLTNHSAADAVASWSRDGRWIYFASNRTGQMQVWKMPARGGEAVQVTKRGGQVAFESPDGRSVYYSRLMVSPLMKIPVQGGEETQVLDSVTFSNFEVVNQGIYFIAVPARGERYTIQFLDFATGKTRPILTLSGVAERGVAVSPDGRTLLYTQLDQQGSDLMLVENFR